MLVLILGCGDKKGATTTPQDGADAGDKNSEKTQKNNEALADLRALKEQGSFEELLATASDVSPTARDAEWESLLETAAVGYLGQLADDEENAMGPVQASERMVELYPFLAKRTGFRKVRAETGVAAHKLCYSSNCRLYMGWRTSRAWSDAVYKYTKIDPEYSAFIAGKMVMTRLIPEVATGMFAMAIEHHGKKVCGDADLKRSVAEAKREGMWADEVAKISKICGA